VTPRRQGLACLAPARLAASALAGATLTAALTATLTATLTAVLAVPSWALAQTATRLLLQRSDATIEIVNSGRADQGARSILELSGCVADESLSSNLFYAPLGGVTARIEQHDAQPAVVEAPLIVVLRPSDGGDADPDQETIEALDADATFGRPPCLDRVEPAEPPQVVLRQGRTTAIGGRFFLDRDSDVGTMDGPVVLTRQPESDGPPIEANASSLRFDLTAGRSTLTGEVRVTAGERVSEANQLELDEDGGVAVLTGDPAVSREGDDEVRGARLIYDLETNDVVVEGSVSASFEIDGSDGSER